MKKYLLSLTILFSYSVFAQQQDSILFSGEKHFKNIQQLTFGGDNAEAYFSFDGKYIVFQKTNSSISTNCTDRSFSVSTTSLHG